MTTPTERLARTFAIDPAALVLDWDGPAQAPDDALAARVLAFVDEARGGRRDGEPVDRRDVRLLGKDAVARAEAGDLAFANLAVLLLHRHDELAGGDLLARVLRHIVRARPLPAVRATALALGGEAALGEARPERGDPREAGLRAASRAVRQAKRAGHDADPEDKALRAPAVVADWGLDDDRPLGEVLAGLKPNRSVREPDEKLLRWTFERGGHAGTFAEFRARALRGFLAVKLVSFLEHRRAGDDEALPDRAGQWSADPERRARRRLAQLGREYGAMVEPLPIEPVLERLRGGQSVVVVASHAGFLGTLRGEIARVPWTKAKIGAGVAREGRDSFDITLVTRGDFQAGFVQLVKTARKTPILIFIVADGQYGADFRPMPLYDLTMPVAQGAATIAYFARAAVYFGRTRWDTDANRVAFELAPGPDAGVPGLERAEWDERYYAFYMERIRALIAGRPEDMRVNSGFWGAIRNQLRNNAKATSTR